MEFLAGSGRNVPAGVGLIVRLTTMLGHFERVATQRLVDALVIVGGHTAKGRPRSRSCAAPGAAWAPDHARQRASLPPEQLPKPSFQHQTDFISVALAMKSAHYQARSDEVSENLESPPQRPRTGPGIGRAGFPNSKPDHQCKILSLAQ